MFSIGRKDGPPRNGPKVEEHSASRLRNRSWPGNSTTLTVTRFPKSMKLWKSCSPARTRLNSWRLLHNWRRCLLILMECLEDHKDATTTLPLAFSCRDTRFGCTRTTTKAFRHINTSQSNTGSRLHRHGIPSHEWVGRLAWCSYQGSNIYSKNSEKSFALQQTYLRSSKYES